MNYRLLGPLEVRVTDGPLPLGGVKQRALLALLLLNANRVVPRARLIDELWGEEPPGSAVTTVQVYVSRLRKLLPDGSLATRGSGYTLELEPDDLDLSRFERLTAEARTADAERASRLLREALELWRGPALAEFAEPFARVEAGRLEELRLAAVEDRIDADLALGRHADLIGELEVLVAEHAHRERLRGQLMLALYRSGRQAEALEAYRAARAALDELGIEPSARLRQLERQVLAQDASLDLMQVRPLVPAADGQVLLPGPLLPSSPFPFVGRADELATLRALLERAERGEGAFVLMTGEPGAGKTRLVRELAHEAADAGALVCYGASDAAVKVPYQPVRDWFEYLLRVTDPEALAACAGDDADVLARLAPAFATVAGAQAPQPGEDTTTDRYQLQATVADFLRRLGGLRPLLLVADDIHWSDGETLALLGRLARGVPEARIVVVATFRKPGEEIQPELADTLVAVSRLDSVARLALPSLSADDVGAFVHDATGARASDDLVTAIAELTDGTPLLLCELWRELVAGGSLEIVDENVSLARPLADLRGPERIGELVDHRVSRLSPQTGAMVEIAAVTGPLFELAVVATAAALDQAAVTEAVRQAARSGIIEEVPAGAPTCRFTHELVRRAIYDGIPRVRLPELHLRVGEALEQSHAADMARVLPELAHHFTLAAPLVGAGRAVEYNLLAAEAAKAASAFAEAALRLSAALELGIGDHRERARVQIELGYLYFETSRMAEAEALFAAARDAATSLEERGVAMHALVGSSISRLSSDPAVGPAEMLPIAEEAIETFERLGDSRGLALAEQLLGAALLRQGRTDESLAARERAIAHADAAGDEVLRRRFIGLTALSLCDGPTPVEEAIGRVEQLRAAGGHERVFDAGLRRILALLLAMAGRFDESRVHLAASSPVLDPPGQPSIWLQYAHRYLVAEAMELAGDLAGAEQEFVALFLNLRDARGAESEARALRAAASLALLCCDQRRWDEAAEYLAYGQEIDRAAPTEGKLYAYQRLAARARVAAHGGRLAEALELARRAVDLARPGHSLNHTARVWLALAEVQRANGQTAEADASVATALALYDEKGNVAAAAQVRRQFQLTLPSAEGRS